MFKFKFQQKSMEQRANLPTPALMTAKTVLSGNHGTNTILFKQRTIGQAIEVTGVGLHSGQRTHLKLRPAPIDTGIVFIRSDLHTTDVPAAIKVQTSSVKNTRMATVLQAGSVKISTIEHLMSACCGLAIDNLYVEVDAEEIPIMDGSSATFIYLLQSAQIVEQAAAKTWLKITAPIKVEEGDKWASIAPMQSFCLDFNIEFDHPALNKTPKQHSFDLGKHNYAQAIAKARTFGFTKEVESLRQVGLARGGHLDNVIVLDDYRILNDDLRYQDEFVRHKILDAMGDLYVIGYPILGHYQGHKSGHGLNNELLHKILSEQAYELVQFDTTTHDQAALAPLHAWLNQAWAF